MLLSSSLPAYMLYRNNVSYTVWCVFRSYMLILDEMFLCPTLDPFACSTTHAVYYCIKLLTGNCAGTVFFHTCKSLRGRRSCFSVSNNGRCGNCRSTLHPHCNPYKLNVPTYCIYCIILVGHLLMHTLTGCPDCWSPKTS